MEKALIALMGLYYFFMISLLYFMFTKRRAAVRSGEVHFKQFRDYSGEFSSYLKTLQNHLTNQFQVPLVFFAVGTLQVALKGVNELSVIFGLTFVLSRMAHSWIHLGKNNIMHRFWAYFIGLIAIGGMWIQAFFMVN